MRTLDRFPTTLVHRELMKAHEKRIICLYGGSSSSKTISALQYLTVEGLAASEPLVITVIGESIPVIKKSVFRDWQRIVMRSLFEPDRFNKLDNTYFFPSGAILQFIPADDEQRFFAMRHDLVLIDEAYNVTKGIFDQVEIRTRRQILLTWNPVAPFWATKLQDERDDVAVIHSTYKKNVDYETGKMLVEQNIVDALERRANIDPNFYRVFVLGEYGTLEGLIYKEGTHWSKCDDLPEEYKRRIFVVDYGFSHDPTSIGELRYADGQFWYDELEYRTGMFNREIFDLLKPLAGRDQVVADSAEPKSNAELRQMGLNVVDSLKGPDSVNFGIQTVRSFHLNVTSRSTNTIKELRNYSYVKNRDGEYTGKPVDNWNHSMDGIRYGVVHIRQKPNFGRYAVS
jgi:phage terminase large subunit